MMNATLLEIYASLRAAELASTRAQPEAPARPGVWDGFSRSGALRRGQMS